MIDGWAIGCFVALIFGHCFGQLEFVPFNADWRIRTRSAVVVTIGAAAWPAVLALATAWSASWVARKLAVYFAWEVKNAIGAIRERYPRLAPKQPDEPAGPFRSLPAKCETCGRFEVGQ